MKANYKVSDKLIFTVEGETQKDIFRQLSEIDEVFSNQTCPLSKGGDPSDNVRFSVRKVEDNEFFEMRCLDPPFARKSFGQHKGSKGTLFPRNKDKEGNWIDHNGWYVWDKNKV